MDVRVFLGVEIGAAVKDKDEFVRRGVGSVELDPRLVTDRAVVSHPKFATIEMVNRNHLVGHSRKLGLDQSASGAG